jgi:hypothetical protein
MMMPDEVAHLEWPSHSPIFQSYQSSFACGNCLLLYPSCTLTQAFKKPPDLPRWTTDNLLDVFTLVVIPIISLFSQHFLNIKLSSTQISSRYKIGLPISIHFLICFRCAHLQFTVFSLSINMSLLYSHLFQLKPISFSICLKIVTFNSKLIQYNLNSID